MHTLIFIVSGEIIASTTGLYYYSLLDRPFKLIFYKILIALFVQSFAWYYAHHGQNNLWLFNFYMIAEIWLMGIAGRILSNNRIMKKVIPYMLVLITGIWCFNIYKQGLFLLANWCFLLASIFYIIVYATVLLYRSGNNTKITEEPAFWLCAAILLYYGCDIPYKSLENYLVINNLKLAKYLYNINILLNILSNIIIATSFYLSGKQKRVLVKT